MVITGTCPPVSVLLGFKLKFSVTRENRLPAGVTRLLSGSPDTTHLPGHRSLRRRPSGGHYFAHSPPLPAAPSAPPDVPPAPAATPASLPPTSAATDSLGQGAWETLVLFCANMCDAQVEMYMGSAMGKTRLGLKGITCQGHLMLDSESRKDANGGVHVSACALTAEEGIVGGELALTNLNADREFSRRFTHARFTKALTCK